jgi:hypothetical protein
VITIIPKSGRTTSKVRAVPAYTWCDRVRLSVRVFSETLLPFVPMCVEDDAKAITYNHMFHEAAWAIAGRDPDGQLRPLRRRISTLLTLSRHYRSRDHQASDHRTPHARRGH